MRGVTDADGKQRTAWWRAARLSGNLNELRSEQMLSPTPRELLLDPEGRPYFLWTWISISPPSSAFSGIPIQQFRPNSSAS